MRSRDAAIRRRILEAGKSLTRTDIHQLFGGSNWNVRAADINRVLASMQSDGLIVIATKPSNGGRPTTYVLAK